MESRPRIAQAVRTALRTGPRGDLLRQGIRVFRDGGDLVLEGEVDEIADKKTALRSAGAVPGVGAIIDRLHVRRLEPRTDRELLELARRSIMEDPALADCFVQSTLTEDHSKEEILCAEGWQGSLEVEVRDGVLTLDGEVPSLLHKRLAGVLVWRLLGCRDVVNGLEVEPPEADDDGKIAEAVTLVLSRTPPDVAAAVTVHVRDGVVYLEGSIGQDQARALDRDVWAIFGVDRVVSGLRPNARPNEAPQSSRPQTSVPR